jgi:hypothetical protein
MKMCKNGRPTQTYFTRVDKATEETFIFKATEEIAISAKTRLLHYFQKIQKTEGDVRGTVSDTFAIVRNYFDLGEEKRMENENAAEDI